uniref:TEP1-F n=1 Tax=Stomoxys calcitrans TaxID=35570 RepID=A0A1I8QF42_STOCA
MHQFTTTCSILLTICATCVLSANHYSIVAPATIRSNRNYSVCVSLHDASTAATIRLRLHSPTSSIHLSQDVTLQPYETKLVDFMPPRLYEKFNYSLTAEGVKGITLNKTQELYAITEGGPRVYIESDKGLYKPGDVVQFRVIVLNEHVQITRIIEPIRIQILDAQKNRIKQFKDIQLDRGVYAAKFQLSKQPILGEWTITVHISGKYNMDKNYRFKVMKYVLPKFSVHIENDRYMWNKDNILRATIYGKYTYGKYVQGTVDVSVLESSRDFKYAKNQTVEIGDGEVKTEVVFDVQDVSYSWKLYIVATLREKHTNVTASAESEVQFQYGRYNLFVPDSGIGFGDKKPNRFELHVENWNGTPVRDRTTPVFMHMKEKKLSSLLDENGVAVFEFEYETTDTFGFNYKDTQFTFNNLFVERSSYAIDDSNCKIKMSPRSSADLSEPLELKVSANHTIPYMIYTLTSHGNIVRQEYIQLPSNQYSHTFRIQATMAMVPDSYLFVYYIVGDQLHYCEFTIRLPHNFVNKLAITAASNVKPGQNITLNVKGNPNSRVSIIAVDKSVLLLNSDNILQKNNIISDLLYDRSHNIQRLSAHEYLHTPGYSAGVFILTNAKYEVHVFRIPMFPTPLNTPTPVRTLFPETWIFKDIDINKENTALTFQVPDTITAWIVRAFSVNDETGFGILDHYLDIEAFQPFFISVTLPYSVKRGEILAIPVTIFNYLQQSHQTEVIIGNNDEKFQLIDDQLKPIALKQDSRTITVPANNGKSVVFRIQPKKVGYVEIRIVAKNSVTSDAVVHRLNVEPEGIAHNYNQDELFTLSSGEPRHFTFYTHIPRDIVTDSEYIILSVSGDIMGSTLENLDHLVQKPTGCGEQNMVNLVPNILILDYLKAMGKYSNHMALVSKAKNFIDIGYQQELTYRHPNGAFSVFGPNKSTESNWLTAYVVRFFAKAIPHSDIEPKIVEEGLKYLVTQQLDDGSFPHRGHLFQPAHQNQYGFTAFVMLTFLEDEKYARKFNDAIRKGMTFLKNNINNVHDIYSLAIMVNTFQKAGYEIQAKNILEKLDSMAREENGLKWWTSNNKNEESANDVEITAYILLAMPEGPSSTYLPIFNWLIKQRTSKGGFGSTHDTVIGLQALIKYAGKLTPTQDNRVKVHYTACDSKEKNLKENIMQVDVDNELILQSEELPQNTRSVKLEIAGKGRVYLQFTYQFYVSDSPPTSRLVSQTEKPAIQETTTPSQPRVVPRMFATSVYEYFIINPIAKMASSTSMSLGVCFTYKPLTEEEKLTNMVILEVQFPSGFTSNNANIEKLRDEENISRIDVQNSATKILIYFESLEGHNEQCLTILADKSHDVESLKPSPIVMYDFYNDKRRNSVMYKL